MDDTSPQIHAKMIQMIRAKTPYERLRMGCSMHDFSKQLVMDAILRKNQTLSPGRLRREVFLKYYGSDFSPQQIDKILKQIGLDKR